MESKKKKKNSYQREWSRKAEPIVAGVLAILCVFESIRIVFVYFDDVDDLLTRHKRV